MQRRALSATVALLVGALSAAAPPAAHASPGCMSTHTSGGGATYLEVCFSEHGNVNDFVSPAGPDHVLAEGYAVCSDDEVPSFDSGGSDFGWDPATTVDQPGGPGTFPLRITRQQDLGAFELDQIFGISTFRKEVKVVMILTNTSPGSLTGVELSRYVDGDMAGSAADDRGLRWADGALLHQLDQRGLRLVARSAGATHTATLEHLSAWLGAGGATKRGCAPAGLITPAGPADLVARVTYSLGTVTAGNAKLLVVAYERV